MTIYTIGFTQKSARNFFELLRTSGAKRLLDVRRNNTSQLAGFSKKDDLAYFLESIGMEYKEVEMLAPEDGFLKEYRSSHDWNVFRDRYRDLLRRRSVATNIPRELFVEDVVLLCSEAKPDKCHRSLAAEFLAEKVFPGTPIHHL